MKNENFYNFFGQNLSKNILQNAPNCTILLKFSCGSMPPSPPSKRVASPLAAWRKSLVLIAINLIDYGAIYCQNISARQCHNSPTKISVRDYRTKIDIQPMTIICYDYVDTKLIINVYRFILIEISCQIVTSLVTTST